ncbi:MAG: endonuclease/exonuclease/phosphatase family protein, partial [Rhodobacteraceae bacterium]|nr:endonuclease/exonuclease/phosphatase family protein [Paracoccaceae bacterium]
PNGVFMGNAILSRWPILQSDISALYEPKGAEESRVVIFAEIDGPRGKIPVFCTHLHWQMHHSHIRQQQVADLTKFIDTKRPWKFPPVLCGDFNADPHAEEVRMLTGQTACPTKNLVFYDAWAFINPSENGFTWDNTNPYAAEAFEPDRRIDYVFTGLPRMRGAGHVVGCKLVASAAVDGVQPSDHYGVLAELRY